MLNGIKHLISMLIHFPTLQINKDKGAFFVLFLLYMCGVVVFFKSWQECEDKHSFMLRGMNRKI